MRGHAATRNPRSERHSRRLSVGSRPCATPFERRQVEPNRYIPDMVVSRRHKVALIRDLVCVGVLAASFLGCTSETAPDRQAGKPGSGKADDGTESGSRVVELNLLFVHGVKSNASDKAAAADSLTLLESD